VWLPLPDYVLDNQELLKGLRWRLEHALQPTYRGPTGDGLSQAAELREHRRGLWYRRHRYKRRLGLGSASGSLRIRPRRSKPSRAAQWAKCSKSHWASRPAKRSKRSCISTRRCLARACRTIGAARGAHPKGDRPCRRTTTSIRSPGRRLRCCWASRIWSEFETYETGDPNAPAVGQRFYYLEIPGKRRWQLPGRLAGPGRGAEPGQAYSRFPQKRGPCLRVPERDSRSGIAVKLRQNAHMAR